MADEIPPGLWQWIAGGLGTVAAGAAAVIGGLFKGQISEVKKEIEEIDKRHTKHIDDIWEVINTERELASQERTRNYQILAKTPTREEMEHGFDRLATRLDKILDKRDS